VYSAFGRRGHSQVTRDVFKKNHPRCGKVYKTCCMKDRSPYHVRYTDLYVAGSPCPAYSKMGANKGLNDAGGKEGANRGSVLFDCVGYIVIQRPKTFILEQVVGLLHGKHKKTFDKVMEMLNSVQRWENRSQGGKPLYHIEYKVVNTCDLTGIPQTRPRLYIIGAHAHLLTKNGIKEFEWPGGVPMEKLSAFLGKNTLPECIPTNNTQVTNLVRLLEKIKDSANENPFRVMYALDLNHSQTYGDNYQREKSPALTRSRAGSGGFYLSAYKRWMTTSDMMRLQGMPAKINKHTATPRQFNMMFGNAMTMPLLARLIRMVLGAAGIIDLAHVPDLDIKFGAGTDCEGPSLP
jgi:site-specific DNA-cytosine methylase